MSRPINYPMPTGEGTADSDDGVTGESGMGTGLDSVQYEDMEAWRQALDNSPPSKKPSYNTGVGRLEIVRGPPLPMLYNMKSE